MVDTRPRPVELPIGNAWISERTFSRQNNKEMIRGSHVRCYGVQGVSNLEATWGQLLAGINKV